MSIIKTFSVGEGDTYYIEHNSNNFTIIDCYLDDDNKEKVTKEIKDISSQKGIITRFISTHPDDDHIRGLKYLDDNMGIVNFYCVKNETTKSDDTDDFNKYCELRDGDKHFYLYKGCSRKWMNIGDEVRGHSGINCLWPITTNDDYKLALTDAKDGKSPNNISPVITYSVKGGIKAMWMGDIESDFLNKVKDEITWNEVDILFAPHHGRESGKVPSDILKVINPKIIVIGEAPSENLNYYKGYNTIKQNTAGDIVFECENSEVHIYVSKENYSEKFLNNEKKANTYGYYIGSLNL